MSDAPTIELLVRWRDESDQDAAAEVFHRYVDRLIALARSRMSRHLARRVDADDVVQSACRSFFTRVLDGRILFQPGSDLWHLLAAITMRKVFGQLEHHTAGKRTIRKEEDGSADSSVCRIAMEAVTREPTAEEVLCVTEERDRALEDLNPLHRRMVEMRLQDFGVPEIAVETGRSERMVRLVLSEFGRKLQERLVESSGS